jgi:hypothetical protein
METSANFSAGLKLAYTQLEAEGKLQEQDKQVIGRMLTEPVLFTADGVPVLAMKRLHLAVRRMYAKSLGAVAFIGKIDWTKIVDWLKAHWLDIVKIAVSIIPFIL